MRTLLAVGIVPEGEPVKSENFMRKASSVSGTVRCMTHLNPCKKVSSAVAVPCTVSVPVTESGVVEAVEAVTKVMSADVAVELAFVDCTLKWYVVASARLASVIACDVVLDELSALESP